MTITAASMVSNGYVPLAAQPPGRPILLAKNEGVFVDCQLSDKEFLLAYPRGAYTTARTAQGHSVFEYDFHVKRLSQSVELMLNENVERNGRQVIEAAEGPYGDIWKVCDPAYLAPLLTKLLRAVLGQFHHMAHHPASLAKPHDVRQAHVGECRVTILISWGEKSHAVGGSYELMAYGEAMPPVPRPPVIVQAHGAPRHNPAAKDSQWVRDRQALSQDQPGHLAAEVNEVLLVDEDGGIAEGTSSNFFAVMGDRVLTAGEGVLEGTVRSVAIQACQDLGIPVHYQKPRLADMAQWQSAFITSTSRLVLPIDTLEAHRTHLHGPPPVPSVTFTDQALVNRIRAAVLERVEAMSTRIL